MVYFQLIIFSGKPKKCDIEITNNYIKIKYLEVAKELLKKSGHLIRTLKILQVSFQSNYTIVE